MMASMDFFRNCVLVSVDFEAWFPMLAALRQHRGSSTFYFTTLSVLAAFRLPWLSTTR